MALTDGCMRAVIEAVHSSPTQAVLYLSGGASQALGWLMSVPGASSTVLETVVPYSRMSMIQLLGKVPTQFASSKTAEEMALLAYNRALKLSKPGCPVLGVGFTGSLGTKRAKLGDHRFHLSTRTSNQLQVSTVTLSKGLRTREQEDRVSSQILIKAIANACKVQDAFLSELTESEVPEETESKFSEDEELEQLISGQICFKVYPFSTGISDAERKVILSGSFNPLHDGHLELLDIATSICGDGYPCFELSVINADKPPLTVSQIKDRVKQFEKVGKTVIVSNQPYFYKKAELFPGSAFVIGADTAVRLINPKYYGNDYSKMLETLGGCKSTGCVFLVAGRNVDGVFKVLEDFDIPEELKDLFISIPPEKFRKDISSTEIRNRQGHSIWEISIPPENSGRTNPAEIRCRQDEEFMQLQLLRAQPPQPPPQPPPHSAPPWPPFCVAEALSPVPPLPQERIAAKTRDALSKIAQKNQTTVPKPSRSDILT